jgi:chemotaxis regulatin CheY-phosphate phosphatase CheZ
MHVRILRQELQEMSFYIQQTRAEIAALRPKEAADNHIMSATEELDAIVTATERATNDILKAAERISDVLPKVGRSGDLDQITDEIDNQVIEIMTACSFQDITGQRVTKVINAMRYIEQRVNSMVEIWGAEPGVRPVAANAEDTRPDAHLLNGPQKEGTGVSQDDVDALLAGLTSPAASAPSPSPQPSPPPPPPIPPPPSTPPPAAAAAEEPAGGGASISQNDIDALFD